MHRTQTPTTPLDKRAAYPILPAMPRHREYAEPMQHVGVALDIKLVERLDAIASLEGTSRSRVVRRLLESYLAAHTNPTMPPQELHA